MEGFNKEDLNLLADLVAQRVIDQMADTIADKVADKVAQRLGVAALLPKEKQDAQLAAKAEFRKKILKKINK